MTAKDIRDLQNRMAGHPDEEPTCYRLANLLWKADRPLDALRCIARCIEARGEGRLGDLDELSELMAEIAVAESYCEDMERVLIGALSDGAWTEVRDFEETLADFRYETRASVATALSLAAGALARDETAAR